MNVDRFFVVFSEKGYESILRWETCRIPSVLRGYGKCSNAKADAYFSVALWCLSLSVVNRTRLSGRAAHGQPVHQNAGLAYADGHPLARFAAIAHAGIERHVIAKRTDLFERGRPITN